MTRRTLSAGVSSKSRRRRPPLPGRRYSINTRATWDLREALRDAAKYSGRSLAAEIEFRLELSFRDEEWIRRLTEIMMASANQMVGELDDEYERDRRWWQFWKRPRVAAEAGSVAGADLDRGDVPEVGDGEDVVRGDRGGEGPPGNL